MSAIIEWASFRLADGRSEADLIAASDTFQEAFLQRQPGFLRRELLRTPDGYADLVHWRSEAEADAVMKVAMESPACLAYFAVMAAVADPAAGVSHHRSLRQYG